MERRARTLTDMTPYMADVAERSSAPLGWRNLTVIQAREDSADVFFKGFSRQLLNLTLTGAPRHEARFAGLVDGAPTSPNTILSVPRGCDGYFAFEAPEGGERTIIVEFDDELFLEHCPDLADGDFLAGALTPAAHRPAPRVAGLIEILAGELDPRTRRGHLFSDGVTRALAIELAQTFWTRRPAPQEGARLSTRDANRITAFIAANLHAPMRVSDLAALTSLQGGVFARAFRATFGRTPYAYVLDARVDAAACLLTTTRLPIADIATAVGFADQQHLTKAFRARFARTPASLRS